MSETLLDIRATVERAQRVACSAAGALTVAKVRRVVAKRDLERVARELEEVARCLHELCSVV